MSVKGTGQSTLELMRHCFPLAMALKTNNGAHPHAESASIFGMTSGADTSLDRVQRPTKGKEPLSSRHNIEAPPIGHGNIL